MTDWPPNDLPPADPGPTPPENEPTLGGPTAPPTQPTPQTPPPAPPSPAPPTATPPAAAASWGWTPPGTGRAGGWTYDYGYGESAWGPPPRPPRPDAPASGRAARRVLATIAIVMLVLVSGSVGAVISAAVHHGSSSLPVAFPGDGNGFGSNGGNSSGNSAGSSTASPRAIAIAAKITPAVVDINTTIGTGACRGEAAGTGMLISSTGEVLTNNHVIDGATSVRVTLANGDTHTAKVLGYDIKDDVALVKIDGVSGLPTVQLGDATQLNPGDTVVAVGNAGGRGGSPAVTSGAVTALGQQVTANDANPYCPSSETLHGMLRVSAPIEPGDSGGPLVDSKSHVIGMSTAAAPNDSVFGQGASSVSFAVPVNKAIEVVHQIESGSATANVHVGERGLLGVQIEDLSRAANPPTNSGASVALAESGSPAAAAGIATGDVIVSLDGRTISSPADLTAALFSHRAGESVRVGWVDSSGQRHDASLTLIAGVPD